MSRAFREFNVRLEDVDMIGGSDNLLEGTNVTKVIVRGDSKMSSLDSTFKNCNELDRIDGDLDLNGVRDLDNMIENTPLLKSVDLKNINNENITANNAFNGIEEIGIKGTCKKGAIQNVLSGMKWDFDNINYGSEVGVFTASEVLTDSDNTTLSNTLEQKARGLEIEGQTYQNLITGGDRESKLNDELEFESIGDTVTSFEVENEQTIGLIEMEGQTYQNLIEGKEEVSIMEEFNATVTDSNMSFVSKESKIVVSEIQGNTVQGYANHVTSEQIVNAINNTSCFFDSSGLQKCTATLNSDGTFTVSKAQIHDNWKPNTQDLEHFINLKPNTKYSVTGLRDNGNIINFYICNSSGISSSDSKVFITDNSGKVLLHPSSAQDGKLKIRVVEGEVPNLADIPNFDLDYIESVGELYVDGEGNPILDSEGKEQYEIELISNSDGNCYLNDGVLTPKNNPNWEVVKNSSNSFRLSQKIRQNTLTFSPIRLGQGTYTFCLNVTAVGGNFNSGCDLLTLYVGGRVIKSQGSPNNVKHVFTIDSPALVSFEIRNYSEASPTNVCISDYIFNLVRGDFNEYVETSQHSNKKSILLPCRLTKLKGYRTTVPSNQDKLYWDKAKGKYCIHKVIGTFNTGEVNYVEELGNLRDILKVPPDWRATSSGVDAESLILEGTLLVAWSSSPPPASSHMGIKTYINSIVRMNVTNDWTFEKISSQLSNRNGYYLLKTPQIIETNITEQIELDTYPNKTYLSTGTINASSITIDNKKTIYNPLGVVPNTDYTLQFNGIGEGEDILVNLGGETKTISSTSELTHNNVTLRTPSTLTTDTLEFNGGGNKISDVMLIEGEITQTPKYIEGIESVGELQGDGAYKIDIETSGGVGKTTQIIHLPQPLHSIGDVKDRLYWSEDKRHYCIEGHNFKNKTISHVDFYNYDTIRVDTDKVTYFLYNVIKDFVGFTNGVVMATSNRLAGCPQRLSVQQSTHKAIALYDNPSYGTGKGVILVIPKAELETYDLEGLNKWLSKKPLDVLYVGSLTPQTIDLPHLNTKLNFNCYTPTTYLEVTNTPMQPNRVHLQSEIKEFTPLNLSANKSYTLQFNSLANTDKPMKVNIGGKYNDVNCKDGINQAIIRTESIVENTLTLSGNGNTVDDVMLFENVIGQEPKYFEGEQSTGIPYNDNGANCFKVDVATRNGEGIDFSELSILSDLPIKKSEVLYFDNVKKKYCINRNGIIEECKTLTLPANLPKIYQKQTTHFNISTGNIKPSKVKVEYNDLE